ncbi:MAG: hypothetical protein AAF251_03750 [Pseudomonadota bacterium]
MEKTVHRGFQLDTDAAENLYLNRALLLLIFVALFAFGLINLLLGFDFAAYPMITHVHAVSMTAWLCLLATQSILGSRGSIALHRRLGWVGAALALFAAVSGVATSFQTIVAGRLQVFEAGYFLMLGFSNMTLFSMFVGVAILARRNTPWHRRLMLGSLLVIFEPVLGRLLPLFIIPFVGGPDELLPFMENQRGAFELLRVGSHLSLICAVMLGDRIATGRFHPVYGFVLIGILALYAVVNFVGGMAGVESFAASLAPTIS